MSNVDSTVTQVEYREIPGSPGYFAGTDGSVWSEWQNRIDGVAQFVKVRGPRRRLKTTINHCGYCQTTIPVRGKRRSPRVHQLILLAFYGPPAEGQVCRHLNCNKLDNRLANLAYGTPAENTDDSKRMRRFAYGSGHGGSKLTELEVAEIRRLTKDCGLSSRVLARRYGVAKSLINRIVSGKSWAHTWEK